MSTYVKIGVNLFEEDGLEAWLLIKETLDAAKIRYHIYQVPLEDD